MKSYFALFAAGLLSIGAIGCDVNVKEDDVPPSDVDVDVAPDETPAVPAGPDVDVTTEETDVDLPDVNVDAPAQGDPEVEVGGEPGT